MQIFAAIGGYRARSNVTARRFFNRLGGLSCQMRVETRLKFVTKKKAFDEIKALRAKGLERRAVNLPPEDQRRMALVFSAYDRFANSLGEGAPLRSTPFSNDEFRVALQSRLGVPLTCLKPYINHPLKSNI